MCVWKYCATAENPHTRTSQKVCCPPQRPLLFFSFRVLFFSETAACIFTAKYNVLRATRNYKDTAGIKEVHCMKQQSVKCWFFCHYYYLLCIHRLSLSPLADLKKKYPRDGVGVSVLDCVGNVISTFFSLFFFSFVSPSPFLFFPRLCVCVFYMLRDGWCSGQYTNRVLTTLRRPLSLCRSHTAASKTSLQIDVHAWCCSRYQTLFLARCGHGADIRLSGRLLFFIIFALTFYF